MARAPKDPNAPKRVVVRKPKVYRALLGLDESGKPTILNGVVTSNADTIINAVVDNPGVVVQTVEVK